MASSPELNSGDEPLTLSTLFPIKIVLPAVVVLSALFVIILFVYFRVKNQMDSHSSSRSALDSDVLKTLPITVFSSANSDCAICLAELAENELGRVLWGCNHAFHLDCIDEWFRVNSSCPICRSSVVPTVSLAMEAGNMGVKRETLPRPGAAAVESSVFWGRAEEMTLPALIV
ncbi:RING-H2 finger protein ATL64-like [Phalaenopsis equestris]|uniref:RING-H2 finger protein ATL64-like n=1 Tax=Phalaenopsis equestris TaxID=78828 RepID=UPI0009E2C769|nr:RING-H2 finger protein ATL64-like [Phalaenopsis equestris]